MKFADRKGGFPHSEISGSKGARASPELIAACHVLHRLSTPRHPSEALMRLIVLSKTHAWGRFARPRYETRTCAHTCALSLPDNDVFHQVSPPRPCGPGKPFHSRCQNLNPPTAGDAPGLGRTRKLISLRSHPRPCASSQPGRAARRWWSQTGSNRRPHACKARALPTELWPLKTLLSP